jgi:hypothetical protein
MVSPIEFAKDSLKEMQTQMDRARKETCLHTESERDSKKEVRGAGQHS